MYFFNNLQYKVQSDDLQKSTAQLLESCTLPAGGGGGVGAVQRGLRRDGWR